MPFQYHELISREKRDLQISYDDSKVLLYNLSVGMGQDPNNSKELPFIYEKPDLRVVPTMAAIFSLETANLLRGIDIDWTQLLHVEQRLKIHQDIPAAARLEANTRIREIVDKGVGRGAVITLQMECKLTTGETLYTMENVVLARGDGGCGGPAKTATAPHALPTREPDFIHVTSTRQDQALLYRLNGDRNPLHVDPQFARNAGFDRPILHGLCTYGIACLAVLAEVCDYDPRPIRRFDARMTSPVYPGEVIYTDIWRDEAVVSFRCRTQTGNVVALDNGYCELAR